MTVLRFAAFGCVLALGAASAHAQTVVTRQIDEEPVETTITNTPAGTVITRRPVAPAAVPTPAYGIDGTVVRRPYVTPAAHVYAAPAAAAASAELDETVGVAPSEVRTTVRRPAEARGIERSTTRTTRVTHRARETTGSVVTARTVRHATRRVARPLVLSPAQRTVVYRTVVQQQVVPATPVAPAGYPPFPAPAYQSPTVVVAPSATTGYGWTAPVATDVDENYVETVPAVAPYPRYTAPGYGVGSVLPASVVVTPLPATAAVRVPAVQPYSYATVDGRVLLVDPVSNTVVADITP